MVLFDIRQRGVQFFVRLIGSYLMREKFLVLLLELRSERERVQVLLLKQWLLCLMPLG